MSLLQLMQAHNNNTINPICKLIMFFMVSALISVNMMKFGYERVSNNSAKAFYTPVTKRITLP